MVLFPSDSSKEWDHFSVLTASCGILIIGPYNPDTLRNDHKPNILTFKQSFLQKYLRSPEFCSSDSKMICCFQNVFSQKTSPAATKVAKLLKSLEDCSC